MPNAPIPHLDLESHLVAQQHAGRALARAARAAAFAGGVPVYVTATDDGYVVMETSTDEPLLGPFETPRLALFAALQELEVLADVVNAPNLHTDGEPDGEWRWLDATAVEDTPYGGVRISEQTIWELAQSLNARGSAVPINGGPTPEGMEPSAPHGDAYFGGDHPANGYAHVGVPVLHADMRLHLWLYSELIDIVAAEIDRGRLAYGSVYFAYEDLDESAGAVGSVLISHALTNDPAVTTLTAGSARVRIAMRNGTARRTARSIPWRSTMNEEQIAALLETARNSELEVAERMTAGRSLLLAARGPIAEHYEAIANAIGVTPEERASNPWALEDAIYAFEVGAIAEARLAAMQARADDDEEEEGGAQPRAARDASEDAFDPAAWSEEMVNQLRVTLNAPEATPAELAALLNAHSESISALLQEDTGISEDELPVEEPSTEEEPAEPEPEASADGGDAADGGTEALQARVDFFETRDWLDAECAARELELEEDTRERWVAIALESGRSVVEELISQRHAPPQGTVTPERRQARSAAAAGPTPTTPTEAYDACMEDARAELEEEEAATAAREGRAVRKVERHYVRALAQTKAAQRYPTVVNPAG